MISQQKCVNFNKYLDQCKRKKNMSFWEHHTFFTITNTHFVSTHIKPTYTDWQTQREVTDDQLAKTIEPTKKATIDFSLNTIADLIQIVEKNPIEVDTEYNINLKLLHTIKGELSQLNEMVGMQALKRCVLDQLLYYIQGFHKHTDDYKHTVISGPPGTGKTEVAKILGNIYSKIGVINKPQSAAAVAETPFKKATRYDLVAGYLGQTAIKTKTLVNQCLGGVLFIDEAYSFGDDNFSKECVDTLCESLSDQKDNLMVIIAGYENELNERFFSLNAGLESRFVWRFKIDNYTHAELWQIFKTKLDKWTVSSDIDGEAWFKKNYNHFSGFGRDVEILLFKVKIAHSRRIYGKSDSEKCKIELADLNNGFETFLKNKKTSTPATLVSSMFL